MALKNNSKYVKAMERRARILRKQANVLSKKEGLEINDQEEVVRKMKIALEDVTAVCILEGFQKQEPMMLVDTMLKELGRAEAKLATSKRTPALASTHFIRQYFQSFAEDPITKTDFLHGEENGVSENGDSHHNDEDLEKLKTLVKEEKFEQIIDSCCEVLKTTEDDNVKDLALLLRATFYILNKQPQQAIDDLAVLIDNESCHSKIRVNALIKRASLTIQACKDPVQDPLRAMSDFSKAQEIDENNADIYHHRGQVNLLTEQTEAAAEDFKKAVELNPDFPVAYVQKLYTDYRQAMLQNNQEAVKNVINLFQQAKEKFPDCVETYALYAQVNFLKFLIYRFSI